MSILEKFAPWIFTLALFALWEIACRAFSVDAFILPAPSAIFAAMGRFWAPLMRHSLVTLWTTFGELDRQADGWDRPSRRMLQRHYHAAVLHLRLLKYLVDGVDRAARHAGTRQLGQ